MSEDKTNVPTIEEGDEGQNNTARHLAEPEALAAFFGCFERHEILPDKALYKEGDSIERIFYITSGKVEIRVAGEVVGTLEGPAVLGVEESHFRVSFPTYVHTAVAVTPAVVIWLDKYGLRTVFQLDPNCAANYILFQTGLLRTITEKMSGLQGRVTGQMRALAEVQEALVERTPKKPNKLPPPPGQLSERLERQSQTIELLLGLLETRIKNLGGLSAILDGLVAKYPEWAEHPDFAGFIRKFREIVESDSKIDFGTPPQC